MKDFQLIGPPILRNIILVEDASNERCFLGNDCCTNNITMSLDPTRNYFTLIFSLYQEDFLSPPVASVPPTLLTLEGQSDGGRTLPLRNGLSRRGLHNALSERWVAPIVLLFKNLFSSCSEGALSDRFLPILLPHRIACSM